MDRAKLQHKSCRGKSLLIGFVICIWLPYKMIKRSLCLVPQSIHTRAAGEQLRCILKAGRVYPLKSTCHDIPKSKLLRQGLFLTATSTLGELCKAMPMHSFTRRVALNQFTVKAKQLCLQYHQATELRDKLGFSSGMLHNKSA